MKLVNAKKRMVVGLLCRAELGVNNVINKIYETLDYMGFRFDVIKLHF